MGSKQSTAANLSHTTKRKRSNTQASHHSHLETKVAQEPIRAKALPVQPKNIVQLFDRQQCAQLFQQYTEPDSPNTITPDGTRQFFEDLGLSIEDVLIFAIAWKMQTFTMGYITREEWMSGMEELGTDSMDKLRAKRPEFESVFTDPDEFKEMYKHTFTYAKNRDQKCMEVETCGVLWTMLLADHFPIVHDFVQFLQDKKPVRVINRDQWNSFLEFVSSDINNYDESSAWPVLFDEFVDWKRGQ